MGGKKVYAVAVLAFGLSLGCWYGVALAGPGQANQRDACSGQDCKVRTVQPSPRAFAAFEPCTPQRYMRIAADGDGGVLRACKSDGGWEAIGGVGSGAVTGFWRDGGAGLIAPVAARVVVTPIIQLAGGTQLTLYQSSGNADFASFAARGFQASSASGDRAFESVQGAQWRLDAAGTRHLVSDGSSVVVQGGLRIASTNSAIITRSPRVTLVNDGGVVAPHSVRTQVVTLTGATPGAECLVGHTTMPLGLVLTCSIPDNNLCAVHYANVTTTDKTPGAGVIGCRAVNP